MREVAAGGAAFPDRHVAAEQERRDETAAQRRLRVDVLLEQPDQDRCALRVPDEHDAAAVVVVGEVVAERRAHAAVGEQRIGARDPRRVLEGCERDLSVDRRVDAARLREARGLRARDLLLAEPDLEVGVDRRLSADRRIDVEAVDGGIRCRARALDLPRAARGHRSRCPIGQTGVAAFAGTAEPHRSPAVARTCDRRGACGRGCRCRSALRAGATAAGQEHAGRDGGHGNAERRNPAHDLRPRVRRGSGRPRRGR